MNQNRPFYSTNTNLYNESFRSAAPATVNGQNVILSQDQQRRIYDTLNTAIVGNSFGLNTVDPRHINVLYAQKQFFPGGVLFTFSQQQPQPQNVPGTCCKCPAPNTGTFGQNNYYQPRVDSFSPLSLEAQMSYGIQPHGLGHLNLQQQAAGNPFQFSFHNDRNTSCSDLLSHFTQVPASKGYPDLSNITGALQQNQAYPDMSRMSNAAFFPLPPIEFSSNAKKLVLSKNVAPCCGHVVDVLEKEKNEIDKKRVSFSDAHPDSPTGLEKSSQMTSDCVCNDNECKNKPKKQENDKQCSTNEGSKQEKKKKEKKQKKSNTYSSDTTASSDSEHNSECDKPKKSKWWNKNKNTKKQSDTSDTKIEESKSVEKEKKANKKRKNKNKPRKHVDSDELQNTSDSSNQQNFSSEQSSSEGN